jgi:hypothetical protein
MITKKPANKIKLNRTQIREGLKQIPIESIIMGEGKKKTLTTKQKGFIRDVATGKTKAQAYIDNYNSKTTKKLQGVAGFKMANNPVINAEIEAFKLAIEAQAYYDDANLKALVLHQLTLHALNENIPPATRVRSLELLGKSYGVGLFVERKEITTINSSHDAKNKLMKQLKDALSRNAITVDYSMTGESLLDEIKGNSTKTETAEVDTHYTPANHIDRHDTPSDTHSIPHNESNCKPFTVLNQDINNDPQDVDYKEEKKEGGEGVLNVWEESKEVIQEHPPVTVWTEKG